MKFGLAIHFHKIIPKRNVFGQTFYKTCLSWSALIVKIFAQMFFLSLSEGYKLTRQNPNVLEFIVVIIYKEFFKLKPVS